MCSSLRSILAVGLSILVGLSGYPAFAQSTNFLHSAGNPRSFAKSPSAATPCMSAVGAPCDKLPTTTAVADLCKSPIAAAGCASPRDLVLQELQEMGKAGQKIAQAREQVLEILQAENSCSAWFREKDSNPSDTFRTLSFEVDSKGEEFVVEQRVSSTDTNIFQSPYVAKVFQADGRYGRITINARGAFFSSLALAMDVPGDGGPRSLRGPRLLSVGPYGGDTMHARVLTLLHEFGHIIDLLPTDEADQDGKSSHNTKDVLHYCHSEIESKHSRTLAASR
jgi:hypothetical protein